MLTKEGECLSMISKVMKRAWEIKREDARYLFGLCLKMAWAEIKEENNMAKGTRGGKRAGKMSGDEKKVIIKNEARVIQPSGKMVNIKIIDVDYDNNFKVGLHATAEVEGYGVLRGGVSNARGGLYLVVPTEERNFLFVRLATENFNPLANYMYKELNKKYENDWHVRSSVLYRYTGEYKANYKD